jgi:hypothetical protein
VPKVGVLLGAVVAAAVDEGQDASAVNMDRPPLCLPRVRIDPRRAATELHEIRKVALIGGGHAPVEHAAAVVPQAGAFFDVHARKHAGPGPGNTGRLCFEQARLLHLLFFALSTLPCRKGGFPHLWRKRCCAGALEGVGAPALLGAGQRAGAG